MTDKTKGKTKDKTKDKTKENYSVNGMKKIWNDCKIVYLIICFIFFIISIPLVVGGGAGIIFDIMAAGSSTSFSNRPINLKLLLPVILSMMLFIIFLVLYVVNEISKKCRKTRYEWKQGKI